jgi:hypothetical protein
MPESASLPWCPSPIRNPEESVNMENVDSRWLDTLYREGFEAVFGSWMGRYACPFLYVLAKRLYHLCLHEQVRSQSSRQIRQYI